MAGKESSPPARQAPNGPLGIGVLALQGDYQLHQAMLERLGVASVQIRKASQLEGIRALIFPGGESTTMLKFMEEEGLMEPLLAFHASGGALYGTCAGAILLARKVTGPDQPALAIMDIDIVRNGYGRQLDSHESLEPCDELGPEPVPMVFIRAPVISRTGENVRTMATHRGQSVLAREANVLVSTFHPELSEDTRIHQYFLEKVARLDA